MPGPMDNEMGKGVLLQFHFPNPGSDFLRVWQN